jgi:hypothetical protein
MHSSDTRNHNSFQISFFKHFIVVLEDLHPLKVLRCPLTLLIIGSTGGYHVCAGSELMEVDGMSLAFSW